MSVRMTIEMLVEGIDDDLAVEAAMDKDAMSGHRELEMAAWSVITGAGLRASDIEVDTIMYWRDE